MKIPEKVRIGGIEYEIKYEPNLRVGNKVCYGVISYDNSTISLSSTDGTGHQYRSITLLHEILHGIIHHACAEIDEEEKVVEIVAMGLYQVLQDNGGRLFDLKE